jgi:O-antigen/teichoic acid export membrane protein
VKLFSPIEFLRRANAVRSRPGSLGAALVKGAVGTAGIKVASALIAFVTSILLAKSLGPAGYGIFSYVVALVALLAIPSELGIPNLTVREIAVSNTHKDWGRMRGYIIWSHRTVAITCGSLILLSATALFFWGERFGAVKLACMWLALLLVPLVSLGALRDAMLRGLRKVLLGQLSQPLIRPLILLVLLLVLSQLDVSLTSPVRVMGLHILSVATAFLIGLSLFLANRPAELGSEPPRYNSASWLKSSIPFGMTAALQLINGRTDILALGLFRPDAQVGIYRVASQLAAVVIFGMQAVSAIQGPHIANLFAKGDLKKLQHMITRSTQAILMVAVPVVIVIILFGTFIIRTIYGVAYEAAYLPLVILCLGQLFNASMGSVASLLNMTGHERDTTKSVLVGAMVNVTLNLALVPFWGMSGAATATAATLVVWNVLMWHKARTRLGIETSPFLRRVR